jgi:hypothetical protein
VVLMLSGLEAYLGYPYAEAFDPLHFDFDKDTPRVDDTAASRTPPRHI